MTIQVLWQSDVNGEQIRQEIDFLGEVFVLTFVGDVIIDTTWQLAPCGFHQDRLAMPEKTIQALLNPGENDVQVRLLERGSAFSRAVWLALTEIPLGRVMTYSDLAVKLKSGPRAVAQACRNNPYPGIIPCHRVVSKAGIGGFMGKAQGPWIELKQRLLSYELDRARGLL